MDALVICGGLGTRARSITKDKIPKIMIEVNGKPFLEYLVDTLYSQGVRRMVLAAGFKADVLQNYLKHRRILSSVNPWMHIDLLQEYTPLGTGGAILRALDWKCVHSNPFLIINGDSLILPDGSDNYEQDYYTNLDDCWGDLVIMSCLKIHEGQYGMLRCSGDDIIKLEESRAGRGWINCGYYIARHEIFRQYYNPICNRETRQTYDVVPCSFERDIVPAVIKQDYSVRRLDIDEKNFIEIGTPEAIVDASNRLK